MKTKAKRFMVGAAVLLLSVLLAACGGSAGTPSKEFKSVDETVSIMMSDKWKFGDSQGAVTVPEGWIMAGNIIGTEGMMVMQYPKGLAGGIEEFITNVEKSYHVTDTADITGLEIPGVSLTKSYSCQIKIPDTAVKAYFVFGESDYAYYTFAYVANKLNDSRLDYFKACCATFQENAPESQTTDTIRWFNATNAILTVMNGCDYNLFGGLAANDISKMVVVQALEEAWSVTDRESAVSNMEWLLTEGHRVGFVEDMKMLAADGITEVAEEERADYLFENYEMTEEEAARYAAFYTAYEKNGENTIAGWDYSRAMSLFAWYYIAGYYTKEEALEQSLALAQTIQSTFDSWDAFTESYLLGYEYWGKGKESSEERRAVYEEIKEAPDSPYNLDWNLTFERSW